MGEETLYSDTFQKNFLAEASRDKNFAVTVLPNLKDVYFTKDWFKDIFKVLLSYVEKYQSVPQDANTFTDHFIDIAYKNKTIQLTDEVTTMVTDIYEKTPEGNWVYNSNSDFIRDKVNAFIKRAAMRDALFDSIHILDKHPDFDIKIVERVQKAASVGISSSNNFPDNLEKIFAKDDLRKTGELLGYKLNRFKQMEKHLEGIQPGFMVLAAQANIGKTALAVNLLLDVLQSNKGVYGLYFSLDDSTTKIVHRFLATLSEIAKTPLTINEVQRMPDPVATFNVAQVRKVMLQLAKEKILDIQDVSTVSTITAMEQVIKNHPHRDNLVVVLDGMYNLFVSDRMMEKRAENIERANRIKNLVDVYEIPIICTGELRKPTKSTNGVITPDIFDITETNKFSYNANVALTLYYENDCQVVKESPAPTITIDYQKNKQSDYRGKQHLTFVRNTGWMIEIDDVLSPIPQIIGKSGDTNDRRN